MNHDIDSSNEASDLEKYILLNYVFLFNNNNK